ncbi:hypothetical protein [Allohahella marinimesophila]|uniref:Uncharacterized protein n=1 Tax=Allohahella marinimesophila TaxID=1054972 RepID=A0ABP7PH78_9GAMM
MNRIILATAAIAALAISMQQARSAEVKGDVNTKVSTGVIIQKNTGIANRNEASIGSVSGKDTTISGSVSTTVSTGAVIQTNSGIASKNKVNIGSVTE